MNFNLEFADPVVWNDEVDYAINDVVFNDGEAYTAINYVPIGTPLTDSTKWRRSGKYVRTADIADDAVTLDKLDSSVIDEISVFNDYMMHQSDYHNNVINTHTLANTLPAAPSGYYMQGMTIDSDGTVYIGYSATTSGLKGKLRKMSAISGNGSELETVSEITFSQCLHPNSLNIANGKLLVSDVGSTKVYIVDIETFTEDTPITLPYHQLSTCAFIKANTFTYLIGCASDTYYIQMYEYSENLSRPDTYADRYFAMPTAANYIQGCCTNEGMYFQLFSLSPGNSNYSTSYIAGFSPSSGGCSPCIFPVGTENLELEDIAIYNGHMYVNASDSIFDLGSSIATLVDPKRSVNYTTGLWGDIKFNKIGHKVTEYWAGNVVPKKIQLPLMFYYIAAKMPERCMMNFRMQPTGHNQIRSPWFPINMNNVQYEMIVGQTTSGSFDIFSVMSQCNQDNMTPTVEFMINNIYKSSLASGYTQTLYPNYDITYFTPEFTIINK